ncbi:hypothetical protein CCACVL1_05247 [Corchorus capsularis]|uniref:Uncharacterized protein n=1 Tax=Corchorus capsularis TaxID=210143 RepID=A0A1R3JLT1_COCAP|nr:hypothetical protein CCACVL1_05247 [Corchorus capsularis]
MESTSPETKASSQPNQGPSLSAFFDAIALQEQCFEQRLLSQRLWSQQFADAQEARIKAVARQTTAYAAEVNHILRGGKSVAPEVGTEIFSSEGGNKEEPRLQLPQPSSISIPRSTSLFQNPEDHVEHRMYSPGGDVSKRGLPNFNCHTNDDNYNDRHRLNNRERRRDGRLRRSPSVERSWNRRRRSPSKSEHRYREDYHSSRVGSFRGHSGDDKGRNHYRRRRSPVDDHIPHHGRSSDSRKHREHRGMKGASSLVTGRNNESRDHLSEDRYNHHGDYGNDKINEHGLPKGTNSCTKYMKTREPLSKDLIVKNEQLDKTSLINKEFDHRDAKELPKLRCKDESEPLGRKDMGRKHQRYEKAETGIDSDRVDKKLGAKKKTRTE